MLNKVFEKSLLIALLMHTYAASAADTTKPAAAAPTAPLSGNVVKKTTAKLPKHHINFESATAKHSPNTFTDISQSMPAAAVKENLKRKHELPSAQTSVLRPGAAAGSARFGPAAASAKNSAADLGAAPDVLSPGKVAIPEPTGSNNTFFK